KEPLSPGTSFRADTFDLHYFLIAHYERLSNLRIEQHKQMIWFWRGQHNPSLQQIKEKIRSC
ncbi:MAG: hypothetical protein WBJ54_13640, partial [Syntrophorhabdus sp.]